MKKLILILLSALLTCSTAYAVSDGTCFDTDTVTMLHMNGSDASTTFTDSSNSGHTYTANGDAQIDTAQSKFGGASGLFDGTGDYLSTSDSTDFDFGTGDFTVDFWARLSADFASDSKFVHTVLSPDTNDTWMVVNIDDETNFIRVTVFPNTRSFAFSPTKDIWYHIAITRSGTSMRAFVDGTQVGSTATDSTDIQSTSDVFVGANHNQTAAQMMEGWIEELRVVKGTAVWTSNFTSPSSEYSVCGARRKVMVVS